MGNWVESGTANSSRSTHNTHPRWHWYCWMVSKAHLWPPTVACVKGALAYLFIPNRTPWSLVRERIAHCLRCGLWADIFRLGMGATAVDSGASSDIAWNGPPSLILGRQPMYFLYYLLQIVLLLVDHAHLRQKGPTSTREQSASTVLTVRFSTVFPLSNASQRLPISVIGCALPSVLSGVS